MGNCLCYDDEEKNYNKGVVRVITYNGEALELKGSTRAKEVTRRGYNLVHRSRPSLALPPETKLRSGEVYYLVRPVLAGNNKAALLSDNDQKSRQKIKIVVTREDLELLLGSSKIISERIVVGHVDLSSSSDDDDQSLGGSPKWRPSLSSIAE